MTAKAKGELTEIRIIERLLTLGYAVSQPVGDNLAYDLVIDDGCILVRAQCKLGHRPGKTNIRFLTRRGGKKLSRTYGNSIDVFLVWYDGKLYMVPTTIAGKNAWGVTLSVKQQAEYVL